MSIYVTVDSNNLVVSVLTVPNPVSDNVDEIFPGNPEYTATLIKADAFPEIAPGWTGTQTGGVWTFEESVGYVTQVRAESIAATRYDHETAGIIVSGTSIDTGRDSQALITGAALSAVIDSTYICNWKTVNGTVSLTATQLIAIATAVRAHVQACFDREAALLAAVTAGTYTDAMLTEGWPT